MWSGLVCPTTSLNNRMSILRPSKYSHPTAHYLDGGSEVGYRFAKMHHIIRQVFFLERPIDFCAANSKKALSCEALPCEPFKILALCFACNSTTVDPRYRNTRCSQQTSWRCTRRSLKTCRRELSMASLLCIRRR